MGGTYTTQKTYLNTDGSTTTYNIEHAASTIDFGSYDGTSTSPNYRAELIGQGFYTTCCTCSKHYSIEFTTGTTSTMERSGSNYIYKIGIDNVNTPSELINAIIAGAGNGNPLGHFTSFAIEGNKLVVYDNRSKNPDPSPGTGTWQNWTHKQFNINAGNGYGTFGKGVAYSGQDFEIFRQPISMRLQIGSEAEDKMDIELPEITSLAMGVNTVDLSTQEGASESIAVFDAAIQYVSSERNRMGAYQNRLEHTVKNLDNAVENTQGAESQIRDMDMAKGMVELSNRNIIAQAAEAMLAQASKMNQGVMNLLQ